MSKFLIYGLIDPDTLQIRYVGLSSTGLKRPNDHTKPYKLYRKDRKSTNFTHCQLWLQKLVKSGKKPGIIVIQEHATQAELSDSERFWIKHFRLLGNDLTNMQDGGYECHHRGYKHSAETIQKLQVSAKARYEKDPSSMQKAIEASAVKSLGSKRTKESIEKRQATRRARGIVSDASKFRKYTEAKKVPVMDQNGKVYASISEAAKAINSTSSNICKHLQGKFKQVKSFKFQYAEKI
jgi:group I intron endonuclease